MRRAAVVLVAALAFGTPALAWLGVPGLPTFKIARTTIGTSACEVTLSVLEDGELRPIPVGAKAKARLSGRFEAAQAARPHCKEGADVRALVRCPTPRGWAVELDPETPICTGELPPPKRGRRGKRKAR